MKIIDLVEKQKNNEMLPKHIKYENEDLYFDGIAYFDKEENNDLLDILAIHRSALTHLYDEVEIIEEGKDIEHIYFSVYEYERLEKSALEKIENKFNELIDEINNLKEK